MGWIGITTKPFRLCLQSAEMGYPSAQFNIGLFLCQWQRLHAGCGTQAFHWYLQSAAKGGNITAQLNAAMAYEYGDWGWKCDTWREAVHWYRIAADHGGLFRPGQP